MIVIVLRNASSDNFPQIKMAGMLLSSIILCSVGICALYCGLKYHAESCNCTDINLSSDLDLV